MSYADRSWLRRRPIVARAHALFIWFWRHHYFNNGEQIAGVGFAHESFPFDTQSLPCLTARWHRQQNALFQGGHRHFRAQRGLPWRQRQDDLRL